jgi:hypothetical protein
MSQVKVKSGDTLSQISQDYNISIEDLVRLNNIEDINKIYVGDTLSVGLPPVPVQGIPNAIPLPSKEKVEVLNLPPMLEQTNIPVPVPRPQIEAAPKPVIKEKEGFFNSLFEEPHKRMFTQGLQAYRAAENGAPPKVFTEKDTDIFTPEILTSIDTAAEYFYGDDSKENQKEFLKSRSKNEREEFKKVFKNKQLDYSMINNVFNTKSIFAQGYDIKDAPGYIKTILGQFKVSEDNKGNWKVKDRYDFSPTGTAITGLAGSVATASAYPFARYLGGVIAPEGKDGKSTPYAPYIDLTIPRSTKVASAEGKKKTFKT